MATVASAAARRYARALFDLARESEGVDGVRSELERFAGLIEGSAELADALLRPLHPVAERRAVLQAVSERLAASRAVSNFFAYLIDRRRIVDFPAIRAEFERLADEAQGRVRAEVVAASPVQPAQRERIARALAARTGRQVELSVNVDPSLIGGLVATVGDLMFDGSLRTQLKQLHANLTKGH